MQENSSECPPAPPPYTIPVVGGQAPMAYRMPQVQVEREERENYQGKCVRGLSISLIVLGCLCFIVQFIEIFLVNVTGPAGAGLWSGIFFIITGALGMFSIKKRTSCSIIAFLVMCIIGAIVSVGPLDAGAIGWRTSDRHHYSYNQSDGTGYVKSHYSEQRQGGGHAMNAILMFAAIINGILLIISAAYACHGLCPSSSSRGAVIVPGSVRYVAESNRQQQMVIMPIPQPMTGHTQFQTSVNHTVTTVMPGQQIVITNPTSAGPTVYIQPDQATALAPVGLPQPPAYDQQPPPQYEEKQTWDK